MIGLRAFLLLLTLFGLVLPAGGMEFRLIHTKGQRVVLASGTIAPGDAARLARALARASRSRDGTKELRLDSDGGLVGEALAMADVMDQTGVTTLVPRHAVCASACASILFVSGKYRRVAKGGILAVHSCYDARNGRQVDFCNLLISQHAEYEGASGLAMMALQQVAGTDGAVLLDSAGAACFGLTREPGTRAARVPPCLMARGGRAERR